MKHTKAHPHLNNNKGLATLETLPLLVIFIVLMGHAVGLFGVVHTAILNSISARTYAFDTFRNRTDLTYFRENSTGLTQHLHFDTHQVRFHLIGSEKNLDDEFTASVRPVSFGKTREEPLGRGNDHNVEVFNLDRRNKRVLVDPAWVMVGYGLCLNVQCGD